ncbi:hypothetical protein V6N11_027092 [Hibiscus sabdariffa]|uniref:Pentatricopeptide repeat-containing protein n=1 Tax=Hibiscus sabdariffa TaxID=183260 RepID=A0ABR2PFZ6_9ROSI
MYMKVGCVESGENVFVEMPVRDLVSWDAIIYGDQLVGDGLSSLVCLREMVLVGIRPDRQIHAVIMKWGLSYSVTIISNSIIYLYAKCGDLQIARRCFDGMFRKDIVSWNTIITAYAIHGFGIIFIHLFYEMIQNAGRWEDAEKIKTLMIRESVAKTMDVVQLRKTMKFTGLSIRTGRMFGLISTELASSVPVRKEKQRSRRLLKER